MPTSTSSETPTLPPLPINPTGQTQLSSFLRHHRPTGAWAFFHPTTALATPQLKPSASRFTVPRLCCMAMMVRLLRPSTACRLRTARMSCIGTTRKARCLSRFGVWRLAMKRRSDVERDVVATRKTFAELSFQEALGREAMGSSNSISADYKCDR